MHSKIEVSIIVPVFNASNEISKTLEGLTQQNLSSYEIIFVNDGSTDDSLNVLKKFKKEFSSNYNFEIEIVSHKQNKGVATTRNTGLFKSRGKYIGWVDAGDYIRSDAFVEMYRFAIKNEADIVWCDYNNIYKNSKEHVSQNIRENKIDCIKGLLNGRLFGGMWNKLIKRDVFTRNRVTFPDKCNMSEDLRVNISLFYFADKIKYLNKSFYNYVKSNEDSISSHSLGSSTLDVGRVRNVKGIEEFLSLYNLKTLVSEDLLLLKFLSKKNLLINSFSYRQCVIWRSVFPETNTLIYKLQMPFYYKFLVFCINKKLKPIVLMLIYFKKTIYFIKGKYSTSY